MKQILDRHGDPLWLEPHWSRGDAFILYMADSQQQDSDEPAAWQVDATNRDELVRQLQALDFAQPRPATAETALEVMAGDPPGTDQPGGGGRPWFLCEGG